MAPARPRVVDDARSETSLNTTRDRATTGVPTSKSKKNNANQSSVANSSSKTLATPSNTATTGLKANGAVEPQQEQPHVDWPSFPAYALHAYRSAYRLQIPASYTHKHAELLYQTCDLALRAPSQVLARKKAHDLKVYKRRQAQQATQTRAHANGVSKISKSSRSKDKRSTTKNKEAIDTTTQLSIEEPPSPNSNSHPSHSNVDSASNPPDTASRKSPTIASEQQQQEEQEEDNSIPTSLNQTNPESTVLGHSQATALQTSIRKHFNAQHLNEAETIARFTYVVRQQGSSTTSRIAPLAQRLGVLPLPNTIAENIAAVAKAADANPVAAAAITAATNAAGATTAANTVGNAGGATAEKGKGNAHTAHSLSGPRTLGGQHVQVEGGYGDGKGHMMGTTSCGRQVRVLDGGGTGTFRLRFRP
ncbi:hypothetical protein LTR05_007778 [Lithohypha guttulata]|uniref:Histone deacetylase complex subunit SAP30 Sin3 binding domain-containing protein n=1 Tax=Lithohypha guttulata TaxID=1690604 RepID=A0AAN7SUB1_9EURO|nr:hypothetical protein LTR05_007778 [Lithohypha guttulata]